MREPRQVSSEVGFRSSLEEKKEAKTRTREIWQAGGAASLPAKRCGRSTIQYTGRVDLKPTLTPNCTRPHTHTHTHQPSSAAKHAAECQPNSMDHASRPSTPTWRPAEQHTASPSEMAEALGRQPAQGRSKFKICRFRARGQSCDPSDGPSRIKTEPAWPA
ncbi:hypothetical protein BCV70DRAFT_69193 [Testicularia cyperi]|uniref:Uncharacterized protein n=1 Tax=Testicularia cyperi TaxID=1882483 RepID=A0A317XHA9_9BASI|nr:hypothetical protein BCV70DRAFT_69193 [Testicularia cyperi]